MVSAWAARQRLVLGQQAIEENSNEIHAIPALLQRLELKGLLITIDAMGTQTEIAERIVSGGGNYLRALKANRSVLHRDVVEFFADPEAAEIEPVHLTTDADRGRIEQRRHFVSYNVDWLFSSRRYADEPRFPHLAMIATVESRVERNGAVARERLYYLCSAKLDPEIFALAARAHWGVENRLHLVLDVVFHDDLARLRTEYGPQNMAVIRHMTMNLIRPKGQAQPQNRRKRANLDPDYLQAITRQPAPLT
jgi:predicted transposase YbfD/YdcC